MKSNYIAQAWLVLLLALGFGGGLAGVQSSLSPRIEANKLAETLGQVPMLVPGSAGGERETVDGQLVYRAIDDNQKTVGWVVPATGQGFADRIGILLGLDAKAENITGVYILEQRETPGLGNKIIEEDWRAQYTGKSTSTKLKVVKTGAKNPYDIDSVTGATISSDSVTDIVNKTIDALKGPLGEYHGS